MANRLVRGTMEFILQDPYLQVLHAIQSSHLFGRGYEVTTQKITIPRGWKKEGANDRGWHQSTKLDFFDIIAYIAKHGEITSIDMEWKFQSEYQDRHQIWLENGVVKTEFFSKSSATKKCTLLDILEEMKKGKTTSFYLDGFMGGTLKQNMCRILIGPWEKRSIRRVRKNKATAFDLNIIKWSYKLGNYYVLETTNKIMKNHLGNKFTSRERMIKNIIFDGNASFGPLSKSEFGDQDPRRIISFIEKKEVHLPMLSILMKQEKYGPNKGNNVVMPDGLVQHVCDHCVHRLEKLLGEKNCDAYCEAEKTEYKP